MKHLVGVSVLVALAFVLRFWPHHSNMGLDIYIHDTYWVIPFRVIAFWCLTGMAFTWFLAFVWTSVRHPS
jgi:hypothetical protein